MMMRIASSLKRTFSIDFRSALYKAPSLPNAALVSLARQVGDLKSDDLRDAFGKEDFLPSYFNALSHKSKVAQLVDLVPIMHEIIKNTHLRTAYYTEYFWIDMAALVQKQAHTLNFAQACKLIHTLGFVKVDNPTVRGAEKRLARHLEDLLNGQESQDKDSAFDALWALTYLQVGSADLLVKLSKVASHEGVVQLSKVTYFLSRSCLNPNAQISKELDRQHSIIQLMIPAQSLEDLLGLFHHLSKYMPDSVMNAELMSTISTSLPLVKLTDISAFLLRSSLAAAHKTKNEALQAQIGDLATLRLNEAKVEDLAKLLTLKLSTKHQSRVLAALILKLRETSSRNLSYVDYCKTLMLLSRGNCLNKHVWTELSRLAGVYLKKSDINDHYITKIAVCFNRFDKLTPSLADSVVHALSSSDRMLITSSLDITRCIVLLSQSKVLPHPGFITHMEQRVFEAAHMMSPSHLAWCVYALARMNHGSVEVYQLIEKKLLELSFDDLTSEQIAAASFGFAQIGYKSFPSYAVFSISNCLAAIVTQYEGSLRQTLERLDISAVAFVQMCWAIAAVDYFEPSLWTADLQKLLEEVKIDPSFRHEVDLYGLSTSQAKYDTVDSFFGALLIQTLAQFPTDKPIIEHFSALSTLPHCEAAVNSVRTSLPKKIVERVTASRSRKAKDALGLVLEFLKEGQAAVAVDKSRAKKASLGFRGHDGKDDLLTSVQTQLRLTELQGISVHVAQIETLKKTPLNKRKKYLKTLMGFSK
jgi:hypothetical protein